MERTEWALTEVCIWGWSRQMRTLGKDTNSYYRFHSRIYDMTRWAFLFGRISAVEEIASRRPRRVLEIGCGTGRNLIQLKRTCPEVACIGVDASADMLAVARSKSREMEIEWMQGTYPSQSVEEQLDTLGGVDVILFSYALTMFNPGWEVCLERAHKDVGADGMVFLVDFHQSSRAWFKNWMASNHVRMEGQLKEKLQSLNPSGEVVCRKGLLGFWEWIYYRSKPNGERSE